MKVDVYDTYAQSVDGRLVHFDVLVPHKTPPGTALGYARAWLTDAGQQGERLAQEMCRFCHVEAATPDVKQDIEAQGYYILKMEGCEGL